MVARATSTLAFTNEGGASYADGSKRLDLISKDTNNSSRALTCQDSAVFAVLGARASPRSAAAQSIPPHWRAHPRGQYKPRRQEASSLQHLRHLRCPGALHQARREPQPAVAPKILAIKFVGLFAQLYSSSRQRQRFRLSQLILGPLVSTFSSLMCVQFDGRDLHERVRPLTVSFRTCMSTYRPSGLGFCLFACLRV